MIKMFGREKIKRELLEQDKICYLCGEEFFNPKTIVVNHCIPQVKMDTIYHYDTHGLDNLLLTHSYCATMKDNHSLFLAVKRLKERRIKRGEFWFIKHINNFNSFSKELK